MPSWLLDHRFVVTTLCCCGFCTWASGGNLSFTVNGHIGTSMFSREGLSRFGNGIVAAV